MLVASIIGQGTMEKKVVAITGASSGIGEAVERLLLAKSFVVVGIARSFQSKVLQRVGPDLFHIHCDITKTDEVAECFQSIFSKFQHVDVLINNAGSGIAATVEDISTEDIDNELAINFKAHLYCIKAVMKQMRQQKSGHIINVISVGGRLTYPTIPLYDAAKHAMLSVAESLSWELKPWGITVSSIEPGAIKTHFGKNMKRSSGESDYKAYYISANQGFARMYKKPQTPEHVAEVIYKAIRNKGWKYNTSHKDLLRVAAYRFLPKRWYDAIIYHYFNL